MSRNDGKGGGHTACFLPSNHPRPPGTRPLGAAKSPNNLDNEPMHARRDAAINLGEEGGLADLESFS
eukprot:4819766-Pyramimonas_sp.AAC.1